MSKFKFIKDEKKVIEITKEVYNTWDKEKQNEVFYNLPKVKCDYRVYSEAIQSSNGEGVAFILVETYEIGGKVVNMMLGRKLGKEYNNGFASILLKRAIDFCKKNNYIINVRVWSDNKESIKICKKFKLNVTLLDYDKYNKNTLVEYKIPGMKWVVKNKSGRLKYNKEKL